VASVSVVGSGQCGLLITRRLAEARIDTTVIERLPEPGGQEPEHPLVDELADAARDAGATLVLGTAAIEFDATRLHSLGVGGARHDARRQPASLG
jgi:NADPH-dependent 2,4-dienoyl-CoA reductase/sulfur reductase-like enzyme